MNLNDGMGHQFVEYKETSLRTFQDKPLSIDRNFLNSCRIIAKLSPIRMQSGGNGLITYHVGNRMLPLRSQPLLPNIEFFPSIVTCEAAPLLPSSVLQNNPEHVVRRFVLVALLLLLLVTFGGGSAMPGVQTLGTVVLGYRRPAAFPVCTAALEFGQNFA